MTLYCSDCALELETKELDGRMRQVCPGCGRVAYRQLKTGAGVLVERDGKLLLVRRGQEVAFPGTWSLPAGYCEVDEPPQATAAREAAEETGLQVRVGELIDVYYFDDDPRGNGLLVVYRATTLGDEPDIDGYETVAAGFFPADDLPGPLCGGGHDQAIEAWRSRALDRWQPGADLRFCPHCTHPLQQALAYGRTRPLCSICGFVHFREPKVGVSVLVEQAGRVLLIQRGVDPGLGKWGLPSGFVEWDETPQNAAQRECAEETGMSIGALELLNAIYYTDDYRGPGINLLYSAQVQHGTMSAGDDATRVQFFSPAELPPEAEIAFKNHRAVLKQWAAGKDFDNQDPI